MVYGRLVECVLRVCYSAVRVELCWEVILGGVRVCGRKPPEDELPIFHLQARLTRRRLGDSVSRPGGISLPGGIHMNGDVV